MWVGEGVSVRLADGAGGLGEPIVTPLATPIALGGWILAGDVNKDGFMDLVTADRVTLLGLGDGSFPLSGTIGSAGYWAELLIDLDEDQRLDLVARDGTGKLAVHRGNGDGDFTISGTFADPIGFPTFVRCPDFHATDMNGDNALDLVYVCDGRLELVLAVPN